MENDSGKINRERERAKILIDLLKNKNRIIFRGILMMKKNRIKNSFLLDSRNYHDFFSE